MAHTYSNHFVGPMGGAAMGREMGGMVGPGAPGGRAKAKAKAKGKRKGKGRKGRGRKATTVKADAMVREGYRPDVAAAAAHDMQRRGTLGPRGGYARKGPKRGPVGKQRAGQGRR